MGACKLGTFGGPFGRRRQRGKIGIVALPSIPLLLPLLVHDLFSASPRASLIRQVPSSQILLPLDMTTWLHLVHILHLQKEKKTLICSTPMTDQLKQLSFQLLGTRDNYRPYLYGFPVVVTLPPPPFTRHVR